MYESYNSLYNIPLVVEYDILFSGNTNVPLRFGPMRNHHDILMSSGEDSQETNLSCLNGDKDVPDILSDMLTKSQVHKGSDDHVHEDIDVVTVVANDDGIDNRDNTLEDVQTLDEGVISKNESILLVFATNRKEYIFITTCTQSMKDMFAHIKENVDLMELYVEQVTAAESRNIMLFINEDRSVFNLFIHLGAIRLIPKLSFIMKVKLYQINVKNSFFNRDLIVDVSLDASIDINNMEDVHMRYCEDLMIDIMLGMMKMSFILTNAN